MLRPCRALRSLSIAVCLLIAGACSQGDDPPPTTGAGDTTTAASGVPTTTPADATATSKPVDADAALEARLAAVLKDHAAVLPAPGMSVAVRLPDGDVVTATHGVAVLSTREPVRTETMFAIASVTKTLVAVLVLRLAEEGELSLDDRLSRWVPTFPGAGAITIRQLLGHISGLPDTDLERLYVDLAANPHLKIGKDSWRRWLPDRRRPPGAVPGEYSNANYFLLGDVVRAVTGGSVAAAVRRYVLAPAGVSPRQIVLQPDQRPAGPVAHGYETRSGAPEDQSDGSPYVPNRPWAVFGGSAGGAVASPAALVTWWDAVLDGRVLSSASLKQMRTYHPVVWGFTGSTLTFGLGIEKFDVAGGEAIGHGGETRGFLTLLAHLPDRDLTIGLALNMGGSENFTFVDALVGELATVAADARR